jgi:rubrerythrin
MAERLAKKILTTRDLLQIAETIHRRVERHYREAAKHCEEPRTRLLLDFLRAREDEHRSILSRYRRESREDLLDAFFPHTPDEAQTAARLASWRPAPKARTEMVLSEVLEVDDRLEAFYRRAAEMAPNPQLGGLFESLANAMDAKRREVIRDAESLEDI